MWIFSSGYFWLGIFICSSARPFRLFAIEWAIASAKLESAHGKVGHSRGGNISDSPLPWAYEMRPGFVVERAIGMHAAGALGVGVVSVLPGWLHAGRYYPVYRVLAVSMLLSNFDKSFLIIEICSYICPEESKEKDPFFPNVRFYMVSESSG